MPTINSFNSKTVTISWLGIFSVAISNFSIFFIHTPKYSNYKTKNEPKYSSSNELETSKEQLITILNDFQSKRLYPRRNHHNFFKGATNFPSKKLCKVSSASLSQEVPLNKHVNTPYVRKGSINTTFLDVPILHDFQEAQYHEQYIRIMKSNNALENVAEVSWISKNNRRLWDDDSALLYNDKNSTIIAIDKNNSLAKGLYLFHQSTRHTTYPHVLMDHLNILAWLRDNAPIKTKFILQESRPFKSLLEELDPFFVADRVIWVPPREESNIITVNGMLFTLMTTFYRPLPSYNSLRRWIWERQLISSSANSNHTMNNNPISNSVSSNNIQSRYILYLSRNSPTVNHGRKIHPKQEILILNIIRRQMKKYQRKESLLVFRGEKANGDTMTLKEQASLFASAQVVIGPHGGAMSNIIWMGLTQEFCYDSDHDDVLIFRQRPQVLEFLIGPGSTELQGKNKTKMFKKTFYEIYYTAPWVEYHHLLYAPNSTRKRMFVNLTEFRLALDDMWSH